MERDRDLPQTVSREEFTRAIERRAAIEDKLKHDAREMAEVLKADVPAFFNREAKRRFVGSPELCEKWNDEQVRAFKADAKQQGERTANEVGAALGNFAPWSWDKREPFPEDPKSLELNPRVWAEIRRIGEGLAALLERHGFPDAESAENSYKIPSYFVAGRFMKSLVEGYWRGLQEHHELTRLIEDVGTRDRREKLNVRWEKL